MIALALALLTGCPNAPECTDNTFCLDQQACIDGKCKDVECLSSSECAIEQFCSPQTYTCEDGCQFNTDCYVTDRCDPDLQQCVTKSCRSTALDCPGGYRCDTATGQCYLDVAPHCERCSAPNQCGEGGGCYSIGGAGNVGYCFLACNPEAADACPAGYSCGATSNDMYVCIGYCPLL